jgi:transcriptional regulator with XRE-family HTH domain
MSAMQRAEPWRTERAADARLAFGRGIRALRRYHGWTQQGLENRSGLDQTVISRLETGAPIGMRFTRILDVLDAMGVDRIAFKTRWEGASVEAFMSRGRRDFDALGPERRWTGTRPSWANPEDPVDPPPEEESDDEDAADKDLGDDFDELAG